MTMTSPAPPQQLIALVDCNNFYVSCERAMDPRLRNRPVVVLSNNDGCAVARSQEAKSLGIKMGAPWFELRHLQHSHGLLARSSNYALYGIMSNRVMAILESMAPRIENYSIDESFLDLTGLPEPVALGREIRARVHAWTHIPVCVGIGSTKTRAKLANHVAKKSQKCQGVFNLESLTSEQAERVLSRIDVADVWGVGRRFAERLRQLNIHSARDLQLCQPEDIRQQFNVVLARTVSELQGISCLSMDDVTPQRKQIMVSRSFGHAVEDFNGLKEAALNFVARAAEKLRAEGLETHTVTVFASSCPFRTEGRRFSAGRVVPLVMPTQDTGRLMQAAAIGLADLYAPGIAFKKAGVLLSDLVAGGTAQNDLFAQGDAECRKRLMAVVDRINRDMGRGTVFHASAGKHRGEWQMKASMKSPGYLSRWDQLAIARA